MLATQDDEFVTQHQDLDLLGLSRPAAEHDQLKDTAQARYTYDQTTGTPTEEGEQARAHRSPTQGRPDRLVTGTIDFWHPTGQLRLGASNKRCRADPAVTGKG
jgi:hypothetical protein